MCIWIGHNNISKIKSTIDVNNNVIEWISDPCNIGIWDKKDSDWYKDILLSAQLILAITPNPITHKNIKWFAIFNWKEIPVPYWISSKLPIIKSSLTPFINLVPWLLWFNKSWNHLTNWERNSRLDCDHVLLMWGIEFERYM